MSTEAAAEAAALTLPYLTTHRSRIIAAFPSLAYERAAQLVQEQVWWLEGGWAAQVVQRHSTSASLGRLSALRGQSIWFAAEW